MTDPAYSAWPQEGYRFVGEAFPKRLLYKWKGGKVYERERAKLIGSLSESAPTKHCDYICEEKLFYK